MANLVHVQSALLITILELEACRERWFVILVGLAIRFVLLLRRLAVWTVNVHKEVRDGWAASVCLKSSKYAARETKSPPFSPAGEVRPLPRVAID